MFIHKKIILQFKYQNSIKFTMWTLDSLLLSVQAKLNKTGKLFIQIDTQC